MRILRYLFSLMLVVFIFRFCGFVSCAKNEFPSSDFVDASLYEFDSSIISGFFTPNMLFSRASNDYITYYSLNAKFVNRPDATGASLFTETRYAFDASKNPLYLYLNYYDISSNKVVETTGFRYFFICRSDNNDNIAYVSQISGLYSVKEYVSSNVPIFTDSFKMRHYLLTGEFDIADIKNSEFNADQPFVPDASSLGFLSDVRYFVDSAAYQYNPNNTPEYISWGQYSTTGIDLSSGTYKVEFALEDNSSYYMNRNNDYLSEYGFDPLGGFGSWALELRNYVGGLVFPSGSNARAIMQGRSLNTGFNGKMISAGLVSASARKHSISAVSRYLTGLGNDDLEERSFRNFLQGYSDNPSRGYMGAMAQNISQLGRVYSLSYNIYARIVDTASGAYGNWLKIDRHNVPYWDGDSEGVLNGKVTLSTGFRISPRSYLGNTFNNYIVENPDEPKTPVPLPTGYYNIQLDMGDTIYNNYRYVNNNYDYGGDINNYTYYDENGDEQSGGSNITDYLGLLGQLSLVWKWYQQLFGGLLPDWVLACIPVFGSMFVAVLVYKFGIGLLS